jgi:hypothetical protein
MFLFCIVHQMFSTLYIYIQIRKQLFSQLYIIKYKFSAFYVLKSDGNLLEYIILFIFIVHFYPLMSKGYLGI